MGIEHFFRVRSPAPNLAKLVAEKPKSQEDVSVEKKENNLCSVPWPGCDSNKFVAFPPGLPMNVFVSHSFLG
jgi:hypothetical protein